MISIQTISFHILWELGSEQIDSQKAWKRWGIKSFKIQEEDKQLKKTAWSYIDSHKLKEVNKLNFFKIQ